MISIAHGRSVVGNPTPPSSRKPLTSSYLALDIRRLAREQFLTPNTRLQWVWKDVKGFLRGTVGIFVWAHGITLVYGLGRPTRNEIVTECIQFGISSNHGGGRRIWFLCPACGGRVAILYLIEKRFRCRSCGNCAYESQYSSRGRSYGRHHRMMASL